jgi:hypothetical protein
MEELIVQICLGIERLHSYVDAPELSNNEFQQLADFMAGEPA